MFKFKNLLPWLITVVVIIAAIGISGASRMTNPTASTDSATVTTVNLTESIEASGYLKAQPYASLTWKTAGTVETVHVQVGDTVKAGDVLLTLQTSSAAANLIAAQSDLINAQKQLDILQNPDGKARADAQKSLTNAYAAWDAARDNLASALNGKSSSGDDGLYDDVTSAETELTDALNAFPLTATPAAQWYYWAARQASLERTGEYDFAALQTGLRNALDSDDADLVDDIVTAQITYELAVSDFAESISEYDTANKVNEAVATYAQAAEGLLNASQSAYEVLVAANPQDVSAVQAKVDSAQASLDSLSILAPFDGEVLSIEHNSGDVVSAGMPALALANRANLCVETLVDEADIAAVKVGNPATITMDAAPDVMLQGTVTFINPVGETVSGLIKYTVRVELDPVKDPLLLGATADVTIQVSQEQPALAVPASAVQSDKTGEYVTLIASDGSTRRVDVVSGESVGDLVVVTGDLQAGDQVASSYQNGVQLNAPNPFGGK